MLAFASAAAFPAVAAQAAEWRIADVAATGITFIDVSAMKREGRHVTFSTWTIKDSQAVNGIDNWKVTSRADCSALTYRDVRVDYYAADKFVETDEQEPEKQAQPDTMAFSKVAVACGTRSAGQEAIADPYAMVRDGASRVDALRRAPIRPQAGS